MHARLMRAQVAPSRFADLRRTLACYLERVVPTLPGSCHAVALADPATDSLVIVTLWDTEAAMLASERSGMVPLLASGLLDPLLGAVTIERYEVTAGTLGALSATR